MTSERAVEPRDWSRRKAIDDLYAVFAPDVVLEADVEAVLARIVALDAATPEPREDGWAELRAALLTALQNNSYRGEWASDDRHMVPMRWDTDDAVDRILADIAPFLAATTPPPERPGTETRCPLEGVHEHAFRGPHRFREWEPGA